MTRSHQHRATADQSLRSRQAQLRAHGVLAAAFIVSLGLHVLAGELLVHCRQSGGMAAQAPDAVSINQVPSIVIDAVEEQPTQDQEATASAASEGQPTGPKPEELKREEHREPTAAEQPVEHLHAPTNASQPDEIPAIKEAQVSDPARKVMAEEKPRMRKKKTLAKKQPRPALQRVAAAGRGRATSSGQVSASRGNLVQYADTVRARIARHKPPGMPNVGTAKVAFSISPSGAIAYARLTQSSGNAALDAASLRAVRAAAPFPPPPGGQRFSTSIPFHFR